jgi:hypothetical protein
MYEYSRAIYRELADVIIEPEQPDLRRATNHCRVLAACEASIERLATDRHYFAKPARTLFNDIRAYFPMSQQQRVLNVVERYVGIADEALRLHPIRGYDAAGNPLECRATTRKGTACQRMPLPQNGYCPSHQHLADTEHSEIEVLAA